nr:hypothetical protein [Tanacetum cinerariifolium]
MIIIKLKERIKSLSGNLKEEKIKRELEEIETINIELDHKVTKLVTENENIKHTYKQLYDSIKSLRVRSKEQSLKDTLSKLKEKAVVNEAVTLHPIDLELLKIDVAPLAPKLQNNRTAYYDYLKHTQEETTTLREIAENERLLNPLNTSLDCAYNHDSCVLEFINSVNAHLKSKSTKKPVNKKIWQRTGKVFMTIGHKWRPTGRTFTLVGNVCSLTRITTAAKVPLRKPIPIESNTSKPVVTLDYLRKSKEARNTVPVSNFKINKSLVVQIVLWYLDFGCSKHMTRDRSQLINFIHKFLGTLKFENDHVAKIMGYGDYKIGNVTIDEASDFTIKFLKMIQVRLKGLVRGLPKLKFEKDHLCSACAMGKSTKKTHKPKSEDTNQEKLYLLHMDLCGPVCCESVNGKKYILVIVDDYSRFTWVKFLRSKDETSTFIIKFLKMIQQNGAVERRNRTLIKAARNMLIYAQAPLFLWAEAVATACFTQNRSIIRLRHGKTPYELLHSKLHDLSFFHVFGALCYPTNDSENLETIHVDFDELTAMASEQSSSGPALNDTTPGTISSGLVRTSSSSTSYVPPSRNDCDLLFQPMFDELLNPPPSVINQAPKLIAPVAEVIPQVDADSTGSPPSTTVDQDAPSPKAVASVCYTQNRSIIRLRYGKTPYEFLHNKLPNLSFLHVFGALCYLTNDSENLGKLQPKADTRIFIGYAPTKKAFWIYNRRPALNEMTPTTISLGLVPKLSSLTPYVLPSRNDWDLLFQPLFDELLTPPPSVDPPAPEVIAPITDVIPSVQAESIGLPSSTTVDQDAPSPSKSQPTPETQSPIIPQYVKEDIHDTEVAHMRNDLLFSVPILEVTSAQSSSTISPHTIMQPDHQIP